MKKITILITLLLSVIILFGQTKDDRIITETNNGPAVREENPGFDCYPNYLYSQLVPYTDPGIASYGSYYTGGTYRVYDNILSTPAKPVDEVTFWGHNEGELTRSFDIAFYTNVDGIPGDLIASFTMDITREYLVFWASVNRYHTYLPSQVTLQAGDFISIAADGAQGGWYWTSSHDGDQYSYQSGYGTIYDDVAFCLGQKVLIPLSPWAIVLGFGLIIMVVLYRARKY